MTPTSSLTRWVAVARSKKFRETWPGAGSSDSPSSDQEFKMVADGQGLSTAEESIESPEAAAAHVPRRSRHRPTPPRHVYPHGTGAHEQAHAPHDGGRLRNGRHRPRCIVCDTRGTACLQLPAAVQRRSVQTEVSHADRKSWHVAMSWPTRSGVPDGKGWMGGGRRRRLGPIAVEERRMTRRGREGSRWDVPWGMMSHVIRGIIPSDAEQREGTRGGGDAERREGARHHGRLHLTSAEGRKVAQAESAWWAGDERAVEGHQADRAEGRGVASQRSQWKAQAAAATYCVFISEPTLAGHCRTTGLASTSSCDNLMASAQPQSTSAQHFRDEAAHAEAYGGGMCAADDGGWRDPARPRASAMQSTDGPEEAKATGEKPRLPRPRHHRPVAAAFPVKPLPSPPPPLAPPQPYADIHASHLATTLVVKPKNIVVCPPLKTPVHRQSRETAFLPVMRTTIGHPAIGLEACSWHSGDRQPPTAPDDCTPCYPRPYCPVVLLQAIFMLAAMGQRSSTRRLRRTPALLLLAKPRPSYSSARRAVFGYRYHPLPAIALSDSLFLMNPRPSCLPPILPSHVVALQKRIGARRLGPPVGSGAKMDQRWRTSLAMLVSTPAVGCGCLVMDHHTDDASTTPVDLPPRYVLKFIHAERPADGG
ncbi:hypothetical protein HU200_003694 [Digitaria exilis]|uniref:Uncharacterized protein n=1 Tax=Digitaria exilis TaxID=1010633 RepID=A0A835KSY6_9POAL|nr:hypothetical protein HU200_003694 [Digitaria exilis]